MSNKSDDLAARSGLLIILSSPSGAGKSTLSRRLMDWDDSLKFSVSATTRKSRVGEVEGREYFFKSKDAFLEMVKAGEMLEHAEVFGNFYGSPKAPVEASILAGKDVLFDIDWQGGQQISNSALKDSVISVFILPPSIAELEQRLNARAQDSAAVVASRMQKSRDEISHWGEYDYVLVNDDLDECTAKLKTILVAERLKRRRRPGLVEHVRNLNTQFEEQLK